MTILLAVIGVFLLIGMIWLIAQQRRKPQDPLALSMQQQIESLRAQVANSLNQNAHLLQKQLESVTQNLSNSSGEINQRLDNAAKLYGELRNQLGQLSQTNAQIQAMVKDVSSLQDILRPPKLRGGMGEVLLENLLGEILPTEHYSPAASLSRGHHRGCRDPHEGRNGRRGREVSSGKLPPDAGSGLRRRPPRGAPGLRPQRQEAHRRHSRTLYPDG